MSLTQHQLAIMLPEIASALDKGVVRKVYSDAHPDSILLEIRVPGANRWLAIHGDARASRLHLVEGKPSQPPMPDPFVMLLRKHLIGTRVTALTQLPNDRVIILHTQWRPGPDAAPDAQPASYQLVAELMGRRSLLLLLDADQLILGSLGPGRANDRDLRTGQPYTAPTPPPDRPNRDPWALAELTADGSRSRHLVRAYAEHLALAERKADTNRIQKRIRRQLKGLGRKEKAVSADLNRAEQAEQYRIWGELLQSAYGQVKRGATEVTVPNYYEPGAPALTIPLEPSRDLQENITWYFKRYRRYSGAIDTIEERLAAIWERLEALREAQQQAQALAQQALEPGPAHKDTPPEVARRELLALERDLEARRLLSAPQQQRSPNQRSSQPAQPYRTFTSNTGRPILVGKGGRDNDALSIRIARGNDLWLHAHDWAGAHVVVRLNRDETIDHQSLLDAATLAAHYSKGRNNTVVDVIYTRAKHVRKPKGLPPGRVTVANTKTIAVRIEPQRIARLFERDTV